MPHTETIGLPKLLSWGAIKPASGLGREEDLLKNRQCLNERFLQPLTFSFGHSEVLGASIDANLQAQVDEGPVVSELKLDHVWRGSLLAAIGWSPSAINDPINLQLLCPVHHADKTAHEARLLAADEAMSADDQ
jgi:hypothetical protein